MGFWNLDIGPWSLVIPNFNFDIPLTFACLPVGRDFENWI